MLHNYHTHTAYCGHATGTPQDYVETALHAGMKTLGFSDHSPYFYEDDYTSFIRMPMTRLSAYCEELSRVREQYRGQIDIRIGLEAEYYPRLFPLLLRRLRQTPVEYLLLGQHYINNEYDGFYAGTPTGLEQDLICYVDQCIDGMQTGQFTYLAHPDLMNFVGEAAVYRREMRRLCREAKACGMPLEFNMNGFLKKRFYPTRSFWEAAGEENASVIIGADAHVPEHLDQPQAEREACQLLADCGLTPLDSALLRPIQ